MSRFSSTILTLIAIALLFFTVFGNQGLLHLMRVEQELDSLQQKNRKLESEIVELTNRIYGIRTSEEVLEKNAREQLGLSKPGEIVYIFPSAAKEPPPK